MTPIGRSVNPVNPRGLSITVTAWSGLAWAGSNSFILKLPNSFTSVV